MQEEKYNLITAVNLVVGVVIGSGIFFKMDDILYDTNGSLFLGTIAFVLVGISVLFGAKVIAIYNSHFEVDGGMIAYGKYAFNQRFGFIVAWFFIAIYFPGLIVALALSFSSYLTNLIGLTFLQQVLISIIIILFSGFLNITRPKLSGGLSSITTFLKLIPLIFIAICGLVITKDIPTNSPVISPTNSPSFTNALINIAFAFDGWIIATSISGEISNSKRNLSRALNYGIIIIFIGYFSFYLGIMHIFNPAESIYLGDKLIYTISTSLLGTNGAIVITLFILISIFGAMHGTILAYIRLPKALIRNGELKSFTSFSSGKESNLFCFIFIAFYLLIQVYADLPNTYLNTISFDVSAIPIIIAYIFYVLLYIGTIKLIKRYQLSLAYYFYIAIASLSSLLIILSSLSDNGILYITLSLLMIFIGQLFYVRKDV